MTVGTDLHLGAYLRFAVRVDPETDEPIDWMNDRATPKKLIDALFAVPLLRDGLRIARIGDDDFAPITAKTAAALLRAGDDLLFEAQDREDDDELRLQVDLQGSVDVRVIVRPAKVAACHATVLDDLIAVGQQARRALRGVAGLQNGHVKLKVMGRDLEYPRVRPPRASHYYPEWSLVTFLDRAFYAGGGSGARPGDPDKLLLPPPPPPAVVFEDGELVAVRWARTLDDDDLVAAVAGHNAWITARVDTDLAEGFNALGDQRVEITDSTPMPPLTLFEPDWNIGYKAVLVLPDGSVEATAWNEAKQVLDARALPDGTPVDAVNLVVPLREHALAIADRARAAGFAGVFYPDDDGGFWNPDPPGPWL